MLLKKQTVWLLTMLSLVVVLTVYYITSPEQKGQNLADVSDKSEQPKGSATENSDDSAVITNASGDEMFEALRIQLKDERSKKIEELDTKIGSTDLPAEEISAAMDELDEINAIEQKEYMLETLIRAMNYEDVLVRANGKNVLVTVKADELSRSAANDIIREVNNEIGGLQAVTVEFKPSK
ncbi:SpoIIIAH-like family protein [Cytobacillus depressus]|uniref:SpoIIIAH-like family protein n=1 Tax=Cytobacillus depressus TaxID=1602942 RepID=A0A6L3VBA3_9BACI|nr:SpoIIIAH-like family protein [Cytobacillus depressus]KAB2338472.1 SpoIIIAH-like family protein [Cytobacillus depressus]